MLRRAVYEVTGPVAIRYPRGGETDWREDRSAGAAALLRTGSDITLVGYGIFVQTLMQTAELLARRGIEAEVVKLNTITPLEIACIKDSVKKTGRLLVAEDCVDMNCVGKRVIADLAGAGVCPGAFALCNSGSGFVTHGSVPQLRKLCGLDAGSLCAKAAEVCTHG